MTLKELTTPFAWDRYSRRLKNRIRHLRSSGTFDEGEAQEKGMRLAKGVAGEFRDGNYIEVYLLVDYEDGIIADAKYQAFGQSALMGAGESACEVLIGKNYDQAKRLKCEVIEQHVKDKGSDKGFPPEAFPHLNLVVEAIEEAADLCTDIPLSTGYVAPPAPELLEGGDGIEGFEELPLKDKLSIIEHVLDEDIRPYIAMDAGGVNVVNLSDTHELTIAYEGACTSCMSSVGATLSYIQQVLKSKVFSDLTVTPKI